MLPQKIGKKEQKLVITNPSLIHMILALTVSRPVIPINILEPKNPEISFTNTHHYYRYSI